MEYLKIFTDFAQSVEALDDAERGRLFMAMLAYADRGEEPALPGNERFVWPTARLHIDREAAFCEKQRERGVKRQSRMKPEPAEVSQGQPQPAGGSQSQPQPAGGSQKDKDKTKDKDKIPPASPEGEAAPRALGKYANVSLTDQQLEQLRREFPADWQQRLDRLSEYVAASGKEYRNCLAVLRSWARRDAAEAASSPSRGSDGRARAAPAAADGSDARRDAWLKQFVAPPAGK